MRPILEADLLPNTTERCCGKQAPQAVELRPHGRIDGSMLAEHRLGLALNEREFVSVIDTHETEHAPILPALPPSPSPEGDRDEIVLGHAWP